MSTFSELASLEGRVALVVGGSGHIGRTLCDALGQQGARVLNADLAPRDGAPADGDFLRVDLRDEAQTRALVPRVLEQAGRLDVLVHCAAYTGASRVEGWAVEFGAQSVPAFEEALRVNLTSAFVLAQAGRDALAAAGTGSIVLVSSIYGVVAPDFALYEGTAMANPAGYGASKAGLVQLGRYLATLFAPAVRVNTVSPGGVWRGQPDAFVEKYVARTPLRRMAVEEDMIGAVAYLASDLSRYVTGQNLVVDGGWTAW